jgi:hypothetical protein
MTSNGGSEPSDSEAKPGPEKTGQSPSDSTVPATPHSANDADSSGQRPSGPNYDRIISSGTLVVLFLTFLAALYAGMEADRLANLTEKAVGHADTAAKTQHSDTLAALQKAEDANTTARTVAEQQAKDTAIALAISKQAADAAKTQSEANRDQVSIMKSQLRANLKIRIENYALNKDNQIIGWLFTPVWTNAGGTEAIKASGWDDIEFFDSGIPSDFDFLNQRHPGSPTPITVPQGDEVMQPTKSLTADNMKQIIDQKGYAIIWGYMEYGDVFPNTTGHHVHYCLRVFPANIGAVVSFPLYGRECNSRD